MESTIGLSTCNLCHGEGRYKDDLGIYIKCKCVVEKQQAIVTNKNIKEPVVKVIKAVKQQLIEEGIIPEHRIEDDWNEAVLRDNIGKMTGSAYGSAAFTVDEGRLTKYIKTLSGLLSTIRMGEKLKSSYLIGASNGFGKTTFANTAIKICRQNGWKVVPYVSLLEIAECKREITQKYKLKDFITRSEQELDNGFGEPSEDEEDGNSQVAKIWQYKDFVNADLLITFLSDVEPETANIEMFTLNALLRERSNKGKATIVLMETGLAWYKNNPFIKKYVLNEVLDEYGRLKRLDRLEYSSVYLV